MQYIYYLLSAILWGIWRRGFGLDASINPFRRTQYVAFMFVLLLPFILLGWLHYVIICGLSALLWTFGHTFDKWTIVLRYPVIGIWYPILRAIWKDKWNSKYFDGYTGAAEFMVGASYGVLTVILYNSIPMINLECLI